jgi:hypothetical protein
LSRGEFQRVLPRLLALATDVPMAPGDPLRPGVEAERRELLAFYCYSLHARAGERDEAGSALRDVLAHDSRGQVVASTRDLSVTCYNPGGLALAEDPDFLLSVQAFEAETVRTNLSTGARSRPCR